MDTLLMPVAPVGRDSVLPSIFQEMNVQTGKRPELDETDEIFFDVGRIHNMLPYPMKSLYGRTRTMQKVPAAVLENDHLRATFLPDYGGRLWSLYDKKAGRELLYVNDCLQPCNLALCNAWTSGGVEWNIGMIGHSPFTCAKMNMAEVMVSDGNSILRFYAYERLREAVYQMDFSLPEGSPVLLCRMRIKNIRNQTIPMYWYSNIAVKKQTGARVIVKAEFAYFSDKNRIAKCGVPLGEKGQDITYAENSLSSVDYFFNIADNAHKYIAYAGGDGRGLFQTSTGRQKGRKLFVWGESTGGKQWQKWLTNQAGDYVEIQAGVNRTQYECLPMPPNAAWEWMEAYGPLNMDAHLAHRDYKAAGAAAENAIKKLITVAQMEAWLKESREVPTKTPGRVLQYGDDAPFAALEKERRQHDGEDDFETHLDFGLWGAKQRPWLTLLKQGYMPVPPLEEMSALISPAWQQKLLACDEKDNWYVPYLLGLLALFNGDDPDAERLFKRAIRLNSTPLAHYALGICFYSAKSKKAIAELRLASEGLRGYPEFDREHMQILCDLSAYWEALDTAQHLQPVTRMDGHVRYFEAVALAHLGKLDAAESILMERNTSEMPAMREGPEPLSELWFYIQEQKALLAGESFDKDVCPLPAVLDYRMNAFDARNNH
jgi:tetratricopeptide (TPR) repeat protein